MIHKEANTSGKLESIYLLSSAGFYIEIVKLCHNNNFKNSNKMGIATFFPKTKSGNSSEDQFKVRRLSAVAELPTKWSVKEALPEFVIQSWTHVLPQIFSALVPAKLSFPTSTKFTNPLNALAVSAVPNHQ